MIEFIRERLAEPGTARSLAVVLFALAGGGNSEAAWEAAIYCVIAILGAWSALRPEQK